MKRLMLCVAILGLTACSAPSVEDLMEDQKLLAKIVERCEQRLESGKDLDTVACQNAVAASKRLLIKGTNDAFQAAKKNAQIVLKDLKRKSPDALDNLSKTAEQAMDDTKKNAEEIFSKAKKLLED